MARRRLLTLGHSYVVGVNRRLACELSRAGGDEWEVVCAAPKRFRGTRDLRPQELVLSPDEGCRVVGLGARATRRVHVFLYGPRLVSLLREGWDVVHAWEEPFVLAGGQIAALTPRAAKLVFRTDQNLDKRYPPPFGWIERRAMQRASAWVYQGVLVGEALGKRRGYQDLPSRRIPYGVDLEAFHPAPARREATLRELGWDSDGPPVIGFVGRFTSEKGLDLLCEALEAANSPWRMLWVGAGPQEGQLRAWSATQGGRARVLSDVGHDQVPAVMNAMDVLCAPSQTTPAWREQFGRMLIEAFASGVAVVGSDSGEIPHVIGEAGRVLPEADRAAWTACLDELLADAPAREALAARGLERARDCFAWPVVARQHLEFFNELTEANA
ncbi:MAG: glycosyltransferase family 4 protein [Planctomycetes bacterium]|nr:glycosyltransferase family 4 protein [Planctomycetota bacterium]